MRGEFDFVAFIANWDYLVQLFAIHENILTAGVIVIKHRVKALGPRFLPLVSTLANQRSTLINRVIGIFNNMNSLHPIFSQPYRITLTLIVWRYPLN